MGASKILLMPVPATLAGRGVAQSWRGIRKSEAKNENRARGKRTIRDCGTKGGTIRDRGTKDSTIRDRATRDSGAAVREDRVDRADFDGLRGTRRCGGARGDKAHDQFLQREPHEHHPRTKQHAQLGHHRRDENLHRSGDLHLHSCQRFDQREPHDDHDLYAQGHEQRRHRDEDGEGDRNRPAEADDPFVQGQPAEDSGWHEQHARLGHD